MDLRTLIVEDEPLSQHYLKSLLLHLPSVDVVALAANEEEAVAAIRTLRPDLVFLDIELHSGTGFEVLRKTRHLNYRVVFTTALEQQAIRMIKLCGVPFLQKPIDAGELACLVTNLPVQGAEREALDHLIQTLEQDHTPRYMKLAGESGGQYVELNEVLYVVSGSPTSFYFRDGAVKTDTRQLKEIEGLLEDLPFFRVAASHLVNLRQVKDLHPSGDSIRLLEGSSVPLSPKKRGALLEQLGKL